MPAAQCPHRKPCSECQEGEKGERQSCLMMAGCLASQEPGPSTHWRAVDPSGSQSFQLKRRLF